MAIGPARMGWWGAGSHMWCDSDVSLIIGNNTLVSHYSIPGGIPSFSPADALRELLPLVDANPESEWAGSSSTTGPVVAASGWTS